MSRLIWTPHALRDLQRLYRFLAEKNKEAASRAIKSIRTQTAILSEHPEIGKVFHHAQPAIREWPIRFAHSGYIVLYRLTVAKIVILTIRHQKKAGYSLSPNE